MPLDSSSHAPVFEQIADRLRGDVAAGVYRPGDLIPSIREMALRLLVNPNTVQRAYEQLEREGLVAARKGVGMVVQASTAVDARKRTEQGVTGVFEQGVEQARRAGLTRAQVDRLYARAWSRTAAERSKEQQP